ncbi:hypothetical protein [Arthrobacter sp. ZBG10]|nr:hypothetical protein [Arthrobacter sp. ZBG10]
MMLLAVVAIFLALLAAGGVWAAAALVQDETRDGDRQVPTGFSLYL